MSDLVTWDACDDTALVRMTRDGADINQICAALDRSPMEVALRCAYLTTHAGHDDLQAAQAAADRQDLREHYFDLLLDMFLPLQGEREQL